MPSIVTKIEEVEVQVRTCEKRLDMIERKLRLTDMTDPKREALENEEQKLHATLETHKKELSSLRFENFKTMLVSVAVLAFMYGIFYIYTSHAGGSSIQTFNSHGS